MLILRNKRFVIVRHPEFQCIRFAHFSRQRIRLSRSNHRLKNLPNAGDVRCLRSANANFLLLMFPIW
jgi:hypothetical protein